MSQELCLTLSHLFPEVSRLALDAGISSWARVREATYYTGLSEDDVIRTKCRLVADVLAYILSYQPYIKGEKTGWWIRIRGLNHFNQATSIGHALVLVEGDEVDEESTDSPKSNKHWLIDAYIGCRGFTCRQVDVVQFRQDLETLEKQYDPEIWYRVTGCREKEIPDHCKLLITQYSYRDDIDSIMARFEELEAGIPNPKYGHKKD